MRARGEAEVRAQRARVRAVVVALAILLALACAGLSLAGCQETAQLSSADKLFSQQGQDTSPSPTGLTSPGGSVSDADPGTRPPRSASRDVLAHGSRSGARVVAIAVQLRAVPGEPGGVDQPLLDALRIDQASATFFMSALWAQAHADVAASIGKTPGFEVGNGGLSTEYLRTLPAEVVAQRTKRAQEILHATTGVTPRVYRDSQAAYDASAAETIARLGLRPVTGDIDLTHERARLSAEHIAESALARVAPGSIIVLPGDGADSRAVKVFVRLLGGLKRQGYGLVNVSDLR